jgi:hypothetical protein
MQPVAVRILHPLDDADRVSLGPLERRLLELRRSNAERLAALFRGQVVDDVVIVTGPPGESFAARVRGLAGELAEAGLVLLGSGAVPLATTEDIRQLIDVATSGRALALANNRYSADVIALGRVAPLRSLPDLPGDNALPRWLEEVAGFEVRDLRDRWWLAMDLDSPLDGLLLRGPTPEPEAGREIAAELDAARAALDEIRAVAANRRAELLVAGRTSAGTLAWLERSTAARIRALIEERGLRASTERALAAPIAASEPSVDRRAATPRPRRPPRSVLGLALDERGPGALGDVLGQLGDAAVVDSRVLLAHRLGPDESAWPPAEERFASDLLLADRIDDPWLRSLTTAARDAPIPVLLGGHSLVGPGIRLALGDRP